MIAISACPPGEKARNASSGGASPRSTTTSAKPAAISARITPCPSPATRNRRTSARVMPEYFTPTTIPMKNCAACTASAGGRPSITPASDSAAVRIIGPRIDAPKRPRRLAPFQPTSAAIAMRISCPAGTEVIGAPGAPDRSVPRIRIRIVGTSVTISSTRVACRSDSARTSPPASSPKRSMSCRPPGIAA